MSFVYPDAEKLKNQPKVGNSDCVALVKEYAPGLGALTTASWHAGEKILRNYSVRKGTAIATFVDGHYPNKSHGNQACFYVGQAGDGIYVIDQFKSSDPNEKVIRRRALRSKGRHKDGTYIDPSNNADAFSVIEL